MNWYQLDIKEVFQKLETSEKGLTEAEAKQRISQCGPNRLAEEEKISKLKILLHQFTSPLIYILLIVGIVTLLLKEYIDSGVIFAVVILNFGQDDIVLFTGQRDAMEAALQYFRGTS